MESRHRVVPAVVGRRTDDRDDGRLAVTAAEEVDDEQALLEERGGGAGAAGAVDDERAPVEDQLVVPPHQVDIGDRDPAVRGDPREHPLSEARLAVREG